MDASILAPIVMASTMATSAAGLDALRWESRVLLVFSDPSGAAEAKRQEAFLQDRERDLAERRMTVIAVRGDEAKILAGTAVPNLSAAELRRRTGIGDGPFAAVVGGLDGGVKWTARTPTPLDDINAVIDAMPMRRAGTDR